MITWLGFYICDTLITVVNQQVPLRGRLAWHVQKARISPLKQPLRQQAWRGAVCFASSVVLFVLISILNETCISAKIALRVLHQKTKLRLQKRRYAFLVRWATTATKLDRRHVTSARKAGMARHV